MVEETVLTKVGEHKRAILNSFSFRSSPISPMSTPSLPSLLSLPAAPIFAHSSSPLPMVAISKSTNKHCPLLLFAHCLCPSLFSLQLVLLVAMLCKVLRITWAESCWRQIVGFDCLFSVIVTLACSCVCLAAQQLCYLDTGHLEF